jgi:hypothetical protein
MVEVYARDESERETFRACVATILQLPLDAVPPASPQEGAAGAQMTRWLAGRGLGLVPVADPRAFAWPGPWIALQGSAGGGRRAVVMYGVPSGVVFDPAPASAVPEQWTLKAGFVLAAPDVALAPPAPARGEIGRGRVEGIFLAARAGAPTRSPLSVAAQPGRGLEGDRHASGHGTFPSFLPGSALTLISAEVCASFDPPLEPDEHRRNLLTSGIDLNALVGCDFTVGEVRCRGMRLCEPCTVVDGYGRRPLLRALVHRGGLRADILSGGVIRRGDIVRVV